VALRKFDAVYCVNQTGIHWPVKFQVWVTLHPEFFDQDYCAEHPEIGGEYESRRAALGLPNGYEIVSHSECKTTGEHYIKGRCSRVSRYVSCRWPGMTSSASSGIFAAKVALDDGHDRVVLAGIPMDRDAGHFTRGKEWAERDSFIPGFEKAIPHLIGSVKSMSGYTRKVLGAPDVAWLQT
jgi:hypothetical protein